MSHLMYAYSGENYNWETRRQQVGLSKPSLSSGTRSESGTSLGNIKVTVCRLLLCSAHIIEVFFDWFPRKEEKKPSSIQKRHMLTLSCQSAPAAGGIMSLLVHQEANKDVCCCRANKSAEGRRSGCLDGSAKCQTLTHETGHFSFPTDNQERTFPKT